METTEINRQTDLIPPHPIECEAPNNQIANESLIVSNIKYLVVGLVFGIVFVKAEIISWYRIQEMFRLQSFHMYGVIGTAVLTGLITVWLIRKFNIKTLAGEQVQIQPKLFHWGNAIGGVLFGLGWAITGACPGPLFAQIGSGTSVVLVTFASAVAGTWFYGLVREKLPH